MLCGREGRAYCDTDEHAVQSVEKRAPRAHTERLAGLLECRSTLLECEHEEGEAGNEELLQTHATDVDVNARLNNIRAGTRGGHNAADSLDDEADDVGEDEPLG